MEASSSPNSQTQYLSLRSECNQLMAYRSPSETSSASGTWGDCWASDPVHMQPLKWADARLTNHDLEPPKDSHRCLSSRDFWCMCTPAAVGIPAYFLAGATVQLGLSWWQGLVAVTASYLPGVAILALAGHPGAKYGIPVAVLSRAAFGVHGAIVAAALRAAVGITWFGIKSSVGASALFTVVNSLSGDKLTAIASVTWLGTTYPEFGCFLVFWAIQIAVVCNGTGVARTMQKCSATALLALVLLLLVWAAVKAGGFRPILAVPGDFHQGGAMFWQVFTVCITANMAFCATLSFPDTTRYAKRQGEHMKGQMALPIYGAGFAFLGIAVGLSSKLLYGTVLWSPMAMASYVTSAPAILIAAFGITAASVVLTNLGADIVAPATSISNLRPDRMSYRTGTVVTAVMAVVMQPWRLVESGERFIYTWMLGYAAIMGPLWGVILADYYIWRWRQLDLDSLYSISPLGAYWYILGYNPIALLSLLLGFLPSLPGLLDHTGVVKCVPTGLAAVYYNGWTIGFFLSGLLYCLLSWLLLKL